MKRFLVILTFLCSILAAERLFHFLTDGFYEHRIVTDLPNRKMWEVDIPPPEGALTQPYRYLSCGGQSFVFESADHQFVIKFFKHHRWRKSLFRHRNQNIAKEEESRELTLMSPIYALKYFQNESRVEYVHLNRKNDHLPTLTCIDRMGRKHHLNLNELQFLIQRKGCTLQERLEERMQHQDFTQAKEDIRKSLDLLASCHHKGIKNRDPYMTRNFGFIGSEPIVIDSGVFCEYQENNPNPMTQKDLQESVSKLLLWTNKHCPPLSDEIARWIDEYYARFSIRRNCSANLS